jgi:hypothetical protein
MVSYIYIISQNEICKGENSRGDHNVILNIHPSLSNIIEYTHDYGTLNILIMFVMNVTY